jgi:hypothetical protein
MITGLAHSRAKSTRECANSPIMGLAMANLVVRGVDQGEMVAR